MVFHGWNHGDELKKPSHIVEKQSHPKKPWLMMIETMVFHGWNLKPYSFWWFNYGGWWLSHLYHLCLSMTGWDGSSIHRFFHDGMGFRIGGWEMQKRCFFLRKIIHSWVSFGVMKHEWMGFDKPSQNIPKHPGSLVWDGVTGWSDEDFLQQNQSMQRRGLGHANTISGTGWTEDVIIYHLIDLIYDIPWFLLN